MDNNCITGTYYGTQAFEQKCAYNVHQRLTYNFQVYVDVDWIALMDFDFIFVFNNFNMIT